MDYLAWISGVIEGIGEWWYLVVFLASLLESLAFIGTLFPGSTVVVLTGFIAGQGYFELLPIILFASLGAIVGDFVSYWLGDKSSKFFRPDSKYLREEYLGLGRRFFEKHGAKSVFLCRFVAPLRAVVPFVAGLSNMEKRSFVLWNVSSGILWAMLHALGGYLFGDLWKEIETWTWRVGVVALALIVVGIGIYIRKRKGRL